MPTGFTQRLLYQSILLARFAYSWVKDGFLAAREPGKIWDLGMNVVLKLSSIFFVVPFTVTVDQHGVRTLRARPKSRRFLTWVWNIGCGLRMVFFLCITLDENFKWFVGGQLTADASFFFVWFVLAFGDFLIFIVFQWQTDELVFLVNAASRLNKSFSRTLFRTTNL